MSDPLDMARLRGVANLLLAFDHGRKEFALFRDARLGRLYRLLRLRSAGLGA